MSYELIIITGEDSGDLYGGNLAKEIQRLSPDINISGVGGRRMRSAGVDIFCDVSDIPVVGFWEVIEKLGLIRRLYKQVVERLDSGNVKGVVLIDYPGFNLKVAKAAKERGIPVFYYISPQVWAWRKSRVKTIKKYVDKIMEILPFEKEFYRKKEIAYMLPPILKASSLIKEKYPSTQFLLPLSSSVDENYLKDFITSEYSHIKHYRGKNYDVMKVSDLLITKSGTSTLEAAIIGTPMMVIYKSSFISFCLAKILVYLSYAGLPNLLAGREIAPELIQFGANPGNIAEKAMYFLKDQNRLNQMKEELKKVKHSLGEPGASKKVAWIIIEYLKNSTN